MKNIVLWAVAFIAIGCGSMNSARPLSKGQHAAGVTFGGPMVNYGGQFIPLPNAVLEGKSGINQINGRNAEISYGINLSGFLFDQVGTQFGTAYSLLDQNGNVPAFSVSDKIYLYSNHISSTTTDDGKGIWVNNQVETIFSWEMKGQLLYTGVANNFDFKNPSLVLNPFIGMEFFHRGATPGFGLQLEARYFALGQKNQINSVEWYDPLESGALGIIMGLKYRFGRDLK
jgi:hypothetical protein